MGQAGYLPWVPLVPTPAGARGPSPGTWASGPWSSAPDPNLSGEPGGLTPGPLHLGLLEGHPGQCGQALGVGPRGLRHLTMASLEGPGMSLSPGVVLGGWLQHSPSARWGQQEGSVGLRWVFLHAGGGWSVPSWAELRLPSLAPSARRLQPRSLLPPPFVLWPGGGRQRWRVEFHFFPLFSLLQETASDDAGG